MLRLQAPGPAGQPRCFPLRAARLFTRFAAAGRSTVRLPADAAPRAGAVQLLLSDCPPDRLRRFLRTLRLKLAADPGPGPASARAKLLSPRPRDFVTISPVQPEELRRVAATRVLDTTLAKRPMEPGTGAKPSTGMSLDCVEISLGRVFASGQAYVALSRARSLQGLRVLDFDPMVVHCDPRVLHYYATLRQGRALHLESPNDEDAASDQENMDPNL